MEAIASGWQSILQFIAVVGIVIVGLALMVGAVKARDAGKHIGELLGLVIVLFLLPGMLASAWGGLLVWQKLGIVAVLAILWLLRQSLRRPQNKHRE